MGRNAGPGSSLLGLLTGAICPQGTCLCILLRGRGEEADIKSIDSELLQYPVVFTC